MAEAAADTFNRADSATNFDGETMSDGSNTWSGTGWKVLSNVCESSGGGAGYGWSGDQGNIANVMVSVNRVDSGLRNVTLMCRTNGEDYDNSYWIWFTDSADTFHIYKRIAGSNTLVATGSSTLTGTEKITLKIDSSNNATALIDDVADLGPTAVTGRTTGIAGLRRFVTGNKVENFLLEDLDGGGGLSIPIVMANYRQRWR